MELMDEPTLVKQLVSGETIMSWMQDLFPICRSITGNGVRETLAYINQELDQALNIVEVPTGTPVFDWTIPKEWNIKDAWVKDSSGKKVIDFAQSNLHVLNYATPIHQVLDLEELESHLWSLPDKPDAIPYITSYYKERWGFCMRHRDREKLQPGKYEVFIDSTLEPGYLTYADMVIEGETEEEILIHSYVCHPSMANNELSGPLVALALAKWLKQQSHSRYTYRFVWGVETIGAITYLSQNLEVLKNRMQAGFVLTCFGDEGDFSVVNSRYADTLADKITETVYYFHTQDQYKTYPFLRRGSDERQYGAPGIELPVVTLTRSMFAQYPEYHTSLDNMDFVSAKGLSESLKVLVKICLLLENNYYFKVQCLGEPQLGKRGLYPTLSTDSSGLTVRDMMNFITYSDGKHDLSDICRMIDAAPESLAESIKNLQREHLISKIG